MGFHQSVQQINTRFDRPERATISDLVLNALQALTQQFRVGRHPGDRLGCERHLVEAHPRQLSPIHVGRQMLAPRSSDSEERLARAAALACRRRLHEARARVHKRRLEVWNVRARRNPLEARLGPLHRALPAFHLDDPQIQRVEAVQQALSLDHERQLADRHSVRDGDRVFSDERTVFGLQHKP